MIPQKDRIESAIRHIQTAADIDPWAMELAVDALEKQSPKRVKMPLDAYFVCPNCACKVDYPFGYCHNCGQAIDWSDVENVES